MITTVVFDDSFANCTTLTSTAYWFDQCENLTTIIGINNLKTDNVTDVNSMFIDCHNIKSIDLSSLNFSNVTNMHQMFEDCRVLESINFNGVNTENVTNMGDLFLNCHNLKSIDLSSFNTSNVTKMSYMFYRCDSLTTVYVGEGWTTKNVTDSESMFERCNKIVGGQGTLFDENHIDAAYAHIDGGTANPGYFTDINAEPWIEPEPEKQEPYAVLSQNNTVMTFFWDDQMTAKGGISLNDDKWEGQEKELSSSVLALLFDQSFSDFIMNDVKDFSINLEGWTSLAAVKAGNISIPAEEYAKVGNPNLLVYVNEPSLAPQGVQNVVINGQAKEIILTDATSGNNNNFFCPEPFWAEKISYTRNFQQRSEIGVSRGWEGLALPFNVQTITHETHGELAPFAAGNNSAKPFWLRYYTGDKVESAHEIEAYVPYVIAMPNSNEYFSEYNQAGRVTFSATNTEVYQTPDFSFMENEPNMSMMTIPTFQLKARSDSIYVINVSQPRNDFAEGSVFESGLRDVRPFEIYTVHHGQGARPRFIPIPAQGNESTGIADIKATEPTTPSQWYDLSGRRLTTEPKVKGVYIQKGRKVIR